MEEYEPGEFTRSLLARAVAKDPTLRLYVVVGSDSAVLGFGVAELQGFGSRMWVWSIAGKIDNGVDAPGVVETYFHELEEWGRQHDCALILHGTSRSERAWGRKYGFETQRAMMARPIRKGDG